MRVVSGFRVQDSSEAKQKTLGLLPPPLTSSGRGLPVQLEARQGLACLWEWEAMGARGSSQYIMKPTIPTRKDQLPANQTLRRHHPETVRCQEAGYINDLRLEIGGAPFIRIPVFNSIRKRGHTQTQKASKS